jgi:hypothetical protein
MEEQALEGLFLLPASGRGPYYGKTITNWIQLDDAPAPRAAAARSPAP